RPQSLLHLPDATILPYHTGGAFRCRPDRRLFGVWHMVADYSALSETGAGGDGHLLLSVGLERLPASPGLPGRQTGVMDAGAGTQCISQHGRPAAGATLHDGHVDA